MEISIASSTSFFACQATNKSFLICHEKWLEVELDGSIRLLDLCGAVRDGLATKKEHVQDLQRRRCATEIKAKAYTYINSRQKAKKDIKNCLRSLKKMDSKSRSSMTIDKNHDLPLVVRVLMEAR